MAETGTVVLDGGAAQGRRALTLLPDLHILVVLAEQGVGGVPETISLLGETVRTRRAQVTFISGPRRRATSSSRASKACTAPAGWSSSSPVREAGSNSVPWFG